MIDILCMLVLGRVAWWSTTDSICLSLVIHQTLPHKVPGIKHKHRVNQCVKCRNAHVLSQELATKVVSSLVILDVFIKPFELAHLEGEDPQQQDHHEQEGVDPPLHQDAHLGGHSCTAINPTTQNLYSLHNFHRYRTWTCAYLTALTRAGLTSLSC